MSGYRLLFIGLSLLLGVMGLSSTALAKDNDLHLHFLYEGKSDAARKKQQTHFRTLTTEFGLALITPVLAPVETLGSAGFDLGIDFGIADIPETKDEWRRAIEDERPDNNILVTRLRLRKGLPYSFEIEGSVGFVLDSDAVVGGVALKWALNEGFRYFPDLGVRFGISRLFGSRDLDLFTVNADAYISKKFSIAGMFTVAPYAGYSLLYMRANSQVLDPTPKNFKDNESASTGNFVFRAEDIFGHRIFFGLQLMWFIANFTLEYALQFPDGNIPKGGPEGINALNLKISFTF